MARELICIIILTLDGKHASTLLWRETLSLPFEGVLLTNILEMTVEAKDRQSIYSQDVQKHRDHGGWAPSNDNLAHHMLGPQTEKESSFPTLLGSTTCGISVPRPGIKPTSRALQGRFFATGAPGKTVNKMFN